MSIKYFDVLDKLPSNITPFGLGTNNFPPNWLSEKEGKNISHLNKFYGEATGIYWIWKNYLKKFKSDDWVGFCQYRRLWLNNFFEKKQRKNFTSLYSNLLKTDNEIFEKSQSILLQPTIFSKLNLIEQFDQLYGQNILNNCIDFEIGSGYPSDLITKKAIKKMILDEYPHKELRWSWKTVKKEWMRARNKPFPNRVEFEKNIVQKTLGEWTK